MTVPFVVMPRAAGAASGIVDALVKTSVWVSTGVASMLYFSGHLAGLPVPLSTYSLAFCSAMFVMNFDHVVDTRFESSAAAARVRSAAMCAIVSAAGLVAMLAVVSPPVRLVCISYLVIGIAYGTPLFPLVWRRPVVWRRLKDIRGIKAWLVSAAIVYAIIALPLAGAGHGIERRDVAVMAAVLYLFIVSNAHMFDVRDVRYDRNIGNTTLPTLIGSSSTRHFLLFANVAGLAAVAALQFAGILPVHPEIELGILLTIAFVCLLPDESSGVRYALVIDGCLFIVPVAARLHEIIAGGFR